jgi:hypothetical protein
MPAQERVANKGRAATSAPVAVPRSVVVTARSSATARTTGRNWFAGADARAHRHQIIGDWRQGTLMRHVLLPGAITTGPRGMVQAATTARLIASAGSALSLAPRRLPTALCTINLAAIAVAADQHLSAAPRAQKQPGRAWFPFAWPWTTSAGSGILPRHSCPARCGARRRTATGC